MFNVGSSLKCECGKKWKKNSWMDKISNEELLAKVEENRRL